jgi:hypothetical protein
MKNKNYLLVIFTLLFSVTTFAQEAEQEIDASKPTNFYSLLDNTLENTAHSTHNVFGYRGKILYAPSEAHLILGEIPLMYNDQTSKFGLGDIRARYFYLPYKNYDKFIGAFGPSVDVFTPTGNFADGLGSGRWIISPGITVGLMAADWIQFFPIISYQYSGKPIYDNPKPEVNNVEHGITFQVITPLVFSDKFFIQITPIFKMNNINNERQDRYIQELLANYTLSEKLQLSAFYNGNFKDKIHTVSAGLTVFL